MKKKHQKQSVLNQHFSNSRLSEIDNQNQSNADGIVVKKTKNGFDLYYRERGVLSKQRSFNSRKELEDYLK